jgi:hypothetical protein
VKVEQQMKQCCVGCFLFFVVGILGLWALDVLTRPNFGSRKFDQAIWKRNGSTNGNNPRMGMIDDLRKNYLRSGISREAVLKLLGKESSEEKSNKVVPSYQYIYHSYRYVYYIGTHKLENWFLSVSFDNEDGLTETEVSHNSD